MATTNENAPITKIFNDSGRRNVVACVDAPTVNPNRMVMVSINGPRAVSANRRVTPDSFNKLPKNSIPNNGRPEGTKNVVSKSPTMGNNIFSVCETTRGVFILITRSFGVVSIFIKGG